MYDLHILSAKSNFLKFSYEDKIHWVATVLHMTGPKVLVVAYPQDKYKHCQPGDILIDDNTKNCSEWINAGGIAIIHKDAATTIRKLKEFDHSKISGRVFLDLDGVMANYDKAYRELGGDPDQEKGSKKANRFKAAPHFYRDLELMPGAMDLWHFLKSHSFVREAFEVLNNMPSTSNLVETFQKMEEAVDSDLT